MIKKSYLLLIVLSSAFSFSQHKSGDTIRTAYITLKSYKAKQNKPLTKSDSLKFKVIQGDTVVRIDNYIKPKGISVPYEYKDSTFLHYYKKTAFRLDNDSLDYKERMYYWKDEIKLFFSKSVSKKVKKEMLSFAKELTSHVDSLKISEVRKVENSNYIIYYFGDFEYESRMADYKNSKYYIYWNNKNQLYRNTIRLDSKLYYNDDLKIYKLKEMFLQSIGHFRFIDDFDCTSYFSNCYSKNKQLTPLDIELLKYHYSYGICKGSNLETFENQHKRAKEAMKKHNSTMSFFHPLE